MAQLVGQVCVLCGERIGNSLDGLFCESCNCPIHDRCRQPHATNNSDACQRCGASTEAGRKWQKAADDQLQSELKSGMKGQPGGDIWYASDQWLRRWIRLSGHEDRGSLEATQGGLQFVGNRIVLRMKQVTDLRLVGPILPKAGIASLLLGNALTIAGMAAGAFRTFTLDNPVTYCLLVLVNAFALGSFPMRWVKVEYMGEDGTSGVAYFTTGSALKRWNGGAKKLFESLRGT